MIEMLSGAVVHPWMSRSADDIAWLSCAIRDKRDLLDEAMTRAGVALADDAEAMTAGGTAAEPAALRSALTRTADALDALAVALSEHGGALERDRAELARTSPHRLGRITVLQHRIRTHTDALSEADVRCRRALELAMREVPSAADVAAVENGSGGGGWAAVFGVQAAERSEPRAVGAAGQTGGSEPQSRGKARRVAPRPRLGSIRRSLRPERSGRETLRTLSTPAMARSLAASPELRIRMADDVPKLGDEPAITLTNLAEAAGVDPQICHAAARVARRQDPSVRAPAVIDDDDVGRARAAQIVAVGEVFAQLGDDAAHRIALLWPRLIGGLDGAPLFARFIANHTLLRAELESARRSEAELEARSMARRVADEPFVVRRLRSAASAAYARRDWLTSLVSLRIDEPLLVRDDLRTRTRLYLRLLTETTRWPGAAGDESRRRALLHFDARGRGRLVEVMGRYDERTDNLAVLVPGTGTGMSGYHMPAGTARDVVLADPSGRTAALCWMGVDFPSAIVNEAILGHFARVAGPELTASVLALDVPPHVAVTVVGHSYGSSVVGAAEVAGLPADRVIHLASPGAGPGVRGVDDYAATDPYGRIRSVTRFACTAQGDPIRLISATPIGWPAFLGPLAVPAACMRRRLEDLGFDLAPFDAIGLGVDPARLEQVQTFEAGVWEIDTERHKAGDPVAGRSGHAGVITAGTTAFRRVVSIITGAEAA